MTRILSVYIDCLRLLAAMTVFIGHANSFEGGMFGKVGWRAAEAVAVFFVLSGFVISYVASSAERSAPQYAIARTARLYSVAVPALALTLLLDALGRAVRPELYDLHSYYNAHTVFADILRCLTFTNELWGAHCFVGSDEPYWSLGYEVSYYLVFGIAVFAPNQYRLAAVVVALAVIGPNVIAYFPLWLIGVGCHRALMLSKRIPTDSFAALASGVALWVVSSVLFFVQMHEKPHPMFDMYLPVRFSADYLHAWLYYHSLGILTAMNILGFGMIAERIKALPQTMEAAVRWAAGGTFTLYLTHQPVIVFMTALMPGNPGSHVRQWIVVVLTLAATYLFAELGERRKAAWRRWLSSLLPT